MHSKGICHRDIKPSNIILTSEGNHVKITDFNVSKRFIKTIEGNKEFVKMATHTGTMAFSAPEMLNREEYT